MLEELSCENRVVGLSRHAACWLAVMPDGSFWQMMAAPGTGGAAAGGLPCSGSACRDGVYHVTAGPAAGIAVGTAAAAVPSAKTVFPE